MGDLPQPHFLCIPGELRNAIYELVLRIAPNQTSQTPPRGGRFASPSCPSPPRTAVTLTPPQNCSRSRSSNPSKRRSALDLLLVCRQIYTEAECLFYTLNHIRYHAHIPPPPNSLDILARSANGELIPHRSRQISAIKAATHAPRIPPVPFISSLSSQRQQALQTVTLTAESPTIALHELQHVLLPYASNLKVLRIELNEKCWIDNEAALDWARQVSKLLRSTQVKEFELAGPEKLAFCAATMESMGLGWRARMTLAEIMNVPGNVGRVEREMREIFGRVEEVVRQEIGRE